MLRIVILLLASCRGLQDWIRWLPHGGIPMPGRANNTVESGSAVLQTSKLPGKISQKAISLRFARLEKRQEGGLEKSLDAILDQEGKIHFR